MFRNGLSLVSRLPLLQEWFSLQESFEGIDRVVKSMIQRTDKRDTEIKVIADLLRTQSAIYDRQKEIFSILKYKDFNDFLDEMLVLKLVKDRKFD